MADDLPAPTVLDRLTAAGLSSARIEEHLRAGRVQVDGVVVTDPYRPAPASCAGCAGGVVTAPPWGHKPTRVADHYAYWGTPPPELSPRCVYWLRRLGEGSWHPNKYQLCEGYDAAASIAGVWIWEWQHVLGPACYADRDARIVEVAS